MKSDKIISIILVAVLLIFVFQAGASANAAEKLGNWDEATFHIIKAGFFWLVAAFVIAAERFFR